MRLVAPEAVLSTLRLSLEPITPAHAAALFPRLQDERLYMYIPQNPPHAIEEVESRYQRLARRLSPDDSEAWLNWAMRLRATGEYVGTLEASVFPNCTALLAYMSFSPFQRLGYAREGCRRVVELLVQDYEVRLIAAEIDTSNVASIALVESLGFARVAFQPDADFFKGSSSDEYRYERRFPAASE